MVSRGDSTLRGHFPGDLVALEKGMDGECWSQKIAWNLLVGTLYRIGLLRYCGSCYLLLGYVAPCVRIVWRPSHMKSGARTD